MSGSGTLSHILTQGPLGPWNYRCDTGIMYYVASLKGHPDFPGLLQFFTDLQNQPIQCTFGKVSGPIIKYYVHQHHHVVKIEEYSSLIYVTTHYITNMRRPDGTWVI
jgi:hypothetical protein